MAGEFKEYPKMLYHDKRGTRVVKDKDEEQAATSQGYKTQAPSQFPESDNPDTANMPDPNADPTREPAIVSQIDQERSRLAGNQGAKDPAQLKADPPSENGDENSEDPESEDEASVLTGRDPVKRTSPPAIGGKTGKSK